MSKRTDSHRPGAITPALYTHLVAYALRALWHGATVEAIFLDRVFELEAAARSAGHAVFGHAGKCGVCGANYKYGSLFRHESGELVHMGHDCADKYAMMYDTSAYELERGRVEAALAKEIEKARKLAARAAFLAGHDDLEVLLDVDHHVIADIRAKLIQYGSISDRQVALVRKIADEVINANARQEPAPTTEPATWTMLRTGEWGVRATRPLTDGETVQVAKRSGEVKSARVGRIVWSGSGVWIAEVAR